MWNKSLLLQSIMTSLISSISEEYLTVFNKMIYEIHLLTGQIVNSKYEREIWVNISFCTHADTTPIYTEVQFCAMIYW